jgi:YD repeat-containing protein
MKNKFSVQWKAVALLTSAFFLWDQVTWADSVRTYESYQVIPIQPESDAGGETPATTTSTAVTNTTIDFLLGANSPLSEPPAASSSNDPNEAYDSAGRLRTEITASGTSIRHVYSGESIQETIDQSSAGDTVFIHAGTYHTHIVLKAGVNLKGEDQATAMIHGDYQSQQHVIRAIGNNRIENLTVSGSGPYAGFPSSAIRIEGDHVKVRHNQILDNRGYGIFVWSGVDTLIEMNLIKDNNLGVQLPKDTTLIRYNTFIHNNIGVNALNGVKSQIFHNIFTGSTFSSIYEFNWNTYSQGLSSRGFAAVENNTFYNNTERGTAYGSATPPTAETQTMGNQKADPLFLDPASGNYHVRESSASYGRGAWLPSALVSALDRASTILAQHVIRQISDGQNTIGYQVLYEEGSVEEFYNDGRQVLDQEPPQIVFFSMPYTNDPDYVMRYTTDGIMERHPMHLVAGENLFHLIEEDIFGNRCEMTVSITLDQIPPTGSITIADGARETHSRTVVLSVLGQDVFGPLEVRFSLDGGAQWTGWEYYKQTKVLDLPEGEGFKQVLCELRDAVGNSVIFSDDIYYSALPVPPVVSIVSATETDQELYRLIYTVDGEIHEEIWTLQPGDNELLIHAANGSASTYHAHTVHYSSSEVVLPEMPDTPVLPPDLILLTSQNGLVMKYSGDILMMIEQPGTYKLYLPELTVEKNLAGGLLVFENGDRLLYRNERPVYLLKTNGEKWIYNRDGTVACMIGPDAKKIRFAYQKSADDQVLSILSFEEGITTRYDAEARPVWIKKADGTQIYYQNGLLTGYSNAAGDHFRYEVSIERDGDDLTGYSSRIVAVRPAGYSSEMIYPDFISQISNFPSASQTLQNDILEEITYDPDKNITQVLSGKGEVLVLNAGLPVSMTDAAQHTTTFQSQISQNGDLLSISWNGGNSVEQVFDQSGRLAGIRMGDGTFFEVAESSLTSIRLASGDILTELAWNGTALTGFRRTKNDGSVEVYSNSRIVERIGADGTRTIFIDYQNGQEPENLFTEDGKTYRVIRYPNSQGLTERLTELVRIDLPNGDWIEFEQGKPVRYIQNKLIKVEPYEVPSLMPGRYFVPEIELPTAKLRSLTVDQNGYIFSGEIYFNDGTQCLIENNEIVRQITANGQFIDFSEALPFQPPEPRVPPEPLTPAEASYRQALIEKQLDYFMDGRGIHAGTGLPVDNYLIHGDQQSDYSQSTLVGFWAEILAAIAKGDLQTSKMTREQAFQKLDALMGTYRTVQQQVGYNGMVAFFSIVETQEPVLDEFGNPTGQTRTVYSYKNCFNQYGFGDALNLAVSFSSVIGALQSATNLDPVSAAYRTSIISKANLVLSAQEPGYAAFYDYSKKRFHGAYALNAQTNQWSFVKDYYIDRVFNEFRPGMAWLAAKYPQYQEGFSNLDVTLRRYVAGDGKVVELAAPFDGGAFQMFWPLIHVDETQYGNFDAALRNFLYAQAEYANQHENPGLLSAGDNPGLGYEGKIGLPSAAEADDIRFSNIGSIYGTASAFGLAPHYTLQFLKNLETRFPEIVTTAGYTDAITLKSVTVQDPVIGQNITTEQPVISTQYFGVDQASFVLSLLKTSQPYFRSYLSSSGIVNRFDSLYQSFQLNLSAADPELPAPPSFGQSAAPLYGGTNPIPDGRASGLVKQASFVPVIFDPDLGEGRVFNYHRADGTFHHVEIEFGEGSDLRAMGLQEYLLLTRHTDMGRAILGGFETDIYNRANSQGTFYTPQHGYCVSGLMRDPLLGEVRRIQFDFKEPHYAVGLWNMYSATPLALDHYDFLSVPVRVGDNTPENIRLKFEFKGTGNIFLTEPLKRGWQYITIPVVKPLDGTANMISTVIQSNDGQPVAGDLYIGSLSGFKVRTSNQLDWTMMLGKSSSEIRTLIQAGIVGQASGGGLKEAQEILENFEIDSTGKLVSGVRRLADGGTQYFEKGLLSKWVFRNGRTVLYEKGIANFVIDLARGKLETGRFYYDQDLKGHIRSFNIQDNDRRRIFGSDGALQTLVQDGFSVELRNNEIVSIRTPTGILTDLEFSDDGGLARAHAVLNDGKTLEIDEYQGNSVDVGGGTLIYYHGTTITAIETAQNGRTDLVYTYDTLGRVIGVDAVFIEEGMQKTQPLFEYILRPERAAEKAQLIAKTLNVITILGSVVGEFSYPYLLSGEYIRSRRQDIGYGSQAYFEFGYPTISSASILGMVFNHKNAPFEISNYGFFSITLMQDPLMDWNQDVQVYLKGVNYNPLYAYRLDDLNSNYRTFWVPLAGKNGQEGEITVELVKESGGAGKRGCIYFKDVSYMSLKTFDEPAWEDQLGILSSQIRNLKIEADNLRSVGSSIARKEPLRYDALVPYLDTPTRLLHTDTPASQNQLMNFRRFDGTQVEVSGNQVSRVILPNGIVNEYSPADNTPTLAIQGSDQNAASGVSTASYGYGALRRIIQPDGRRYDLSYEYDAQGKEITVFTDSLSGESRRFMDGKLLTSTDTSGLVTHYLYEEGEMIGAEMTYRDRVLNSTRYAYEGEETQVTDERGTIWFYDSNGKLIKHLTRDGFLYEYADYYQPLGEGQVLVPGDYKNVLYALTGLKAVNLKGYQAPDGSWVVFEGAEGSEVHLASGAQAVNLELDSEQCIKKGQIQFGDGLILEIENYIPVRSRLADGQLREYEIPQGSAYELLQDSDGVFQGFRIKNGDFTHTYNPAGRLIRSETEYGETHAFTYQNNIFGTVTSYTDTQARQLAFNGVSFPKQCELLASQDQALKDSGNEIASHAGNGFLVGIYKEAVNQWDIYSGTFASAADRAGLKHFLSSIKAGEYIAAAVSDPSFSVADEELLALFEGLGAGQVRQASSTNQTWTFYGNERLSKGEGSEMTGADHFSTERIDSLTQDIPEGISPSFQVVSMFMGFTPDVYEAYGEFLKEYQSLRVEKDLQRLTVYDTSDEIVFTQRIDGISAFYEHGKVRETFEASGELLSVHEYSCSAGNCDSAASMQLQKIMLVKARQDFVEESRKSAEQIERAKFEALFRLAWQDEVARLQIKENVDVGAAQINSQISSLQSQRFKTEKKCQRFLFWKTCKEYTYEVPGVQTAINDLAAQRAELIRTGEEQLANIPGTVAAKKLEIEQATAAKLAELEDQKQDFLLEILTQEMEPVITDRFRKILGRDASKQEFEYWIDRYRVAGEIDTVALSNEIQNSSEKSAREVQKAAIIQNVGDFLDDYLASTLEARAQQLQGLMLDATEVVSVSREDADKIVEWLRSRDLHFGQSAFLSLREMLFSKGVDIPMEVIARETILIDILSGVINRFSEGDLMISMFALNRAAAIHGKNFSTVQYTYDDLRSMYQSACGAAPACSLRMIAHIGEDHFVVLEQVTDSEVTYRETGKGASGESVTITKDQFLKVWIANNSTGHLLASEEQVILAKKLSDEEAMKIRGAFWFIFFFVASLVLTAASLVVSVFSPTFGKFLGYAALVAGIVGIVAGLGGFVVQGLKSVFSAITSQGIFSTIKQGFLSIGKMLWNSVTYVGRFFQNGFVFLKECFSGGLNAIGSGLISVKDFLLHGAGDVIRDASGNIIGHAFTKGQVVARQLVAAGLMISASKGLEGWGLNPQLSQLAGAFVGGGFLGIGSVTSNFIRSGLQMLAFQGVSQISNHIGLAPPISGALSLIASTGLTSFFSGNFSLKPFTEIVPQLSSQLTLGGLDLLGRSMGLNAQFAQLIGLPFAAIAGNISNILINPGAAFSPEDVFQLIKDAVLNRETLGGIIGMGFDFITAKLDINSLFSALGLRLATAGVMGMVNPDQTVMSSMAEALLDSFKKINPLYGLNMANVASLEFYFSQALNFIDLIRQKGLLEALDLYAASIFARDAIESILHQGGLVDILTGRAEYTTVNGIPVKIFRIDANNDLYFSTTDDTVLLGRRSGDQVERGVFVVGTDGKFLLKEGVVETAFPDGMHTVLEVKNGQAYGYRVFSDDKDLFEIYATGGNQIALNPDGSIYSAVFINKVTGAKLEFSSGQLVSLSMMAPSGQSINVSGMTLAQLTSIQKQGLVSYIASNGIWNTKPEGVSPDYEINLINRLVERGVDPSSIFLAPLYENGNPITDTFSWVTDMLGGDQITNELINKLDQKWIALTPVQQEHGIVSVLYSGSVNPFLKAIDRRDYNVSTIISLGGPSIEGTFYEGHIDNPHVKTFVNVYGDKDYVPLAGPILGGNKSFEGITTLNIKILGADHFDYFPAADGSNKVGKFIAEIARLSDSNDKNALADFLAKYKQGDMYIVDSLTLPNEYE